jgi:hypothetical protein
MIVRFISSVYITNGNDAFLNSSALLAGRLEPAAGFFANPELTRDATEGHSITHQGTTQDTLQPKLI